MCGGVGVVVCVSKATKIVNHVEYVERSKMDD